MVFNHKWLINSDLEVNSVPHCLNKFLLNSVWLLFILSHWDLLRGDVWDLLNDGVVHSLCGFIGYGDFFFIRDLVLNCVWYLS